MGGRWEEEEERENRNINVITVTVHGLDHKCYSAMLYFHITIRQMSCDINTIQCKSQKPVLNVPDTHPYDEMGSGDQCRSRGIK